MIEKELYITICSFHWVYDESVLNGIGESENSGNPVPEQVDNFPTGDGEVDQPIYEGPQTWESY